MRMYDAQYSTMISWQDGLYAIIAFYSSGYYQDVIQHNDNLKKLVLQKINYFESKIFEIIDKHDFDSVILNKFLSYADFAKIIKFYFTLFKISDDYKSKAYGALRKIFIFLYNQQKYNGEWKNLSETTELILAILFCKDIFHTELRDIALEIERMISNSISFIKQEFDYDKNCWLDDENTSAKALHSVVLYENIYCSIFNDFLFHAIAVSEKNISSVNIDNNIKALDFAQMEYNKLVIEKNGLAKDKITLISENKKNRKLIRTFKAIVGTLSVALAISLLFIICIFGILASAYKDILNKILSENIAIILSTALGLVVTTILTGVFQYIKSKLTKDEEEKK